ncbi:hypothetical protein AALP_AAs60954U000100 [Arabis alpina]|uniref:Uncharacterized protein n=1 Tax=Arabis alpina TaxID=50452 RepID=A0A087G1T7_ARAAL|nr:hypothetical protein AALP_AAs60954U000100 [Arabis alpina]
MRPGDIGVDGVDGVMPSSTVDDGVGIGGVIGVDDGVDISGVDADGLGVQHADVIETVGGTIPLNDEDPDLPSGNAFRSSSTSSSV